jgi:hypothetical protein
MLPASRISSYRFAALAMLVVGSVLLLAIAFAASSFGVQYRTAIVVVAFGVLLVSLLKAPAVGLAIWLLAAANMLPLVDLSSLSVPGSFAMNDALVILLIVAAFLQGVGVGRTQVRSRLLVLCAAIGAWWLFQVARTIAVEGIPPLYAVLFGRDFLYPPIVLVCCLVLFRRDRRIAVSLGVVAVGAAVYAVGYLVYAFGGYEITWLVHPTVSGEVASGLGRAYGPANWVVVMMLPVLAWQSLTQRARKAGLFAVAAGLLLAQVMSALTRANYISVVAGIAAACVLVALAPCYARLRARVGVRLLIVGVAVLVGLLVLPSLMASLASSSNRLVFIGDRAASLLALLGGGASPSITTWQERLAWATATLRLLRPDIVWGLGLLHPSIRHFPQLVDGTIRNPHLGLLEALAPLGIIGLALLLAPTVVTLVLTTQKRLVSRVSAADQALVVGLWAFLVGAVACSVTQSTLVTWVGTGVAIACIVTILDPLPPRGSRESTSSQATKLDSRR